MDGGKRELAPDVLPFSALGQWDALVQGPPDELVPFGEHTVDLRLRVREDVDAYGGSGR